MKKIIAIIAVSLAAGLSAMADDKPVSISQLPSAAQTFINDTYPGEKISYALVDDDLIRPDYKVVMESGATIGFQNDGRLEKIESKAGIPAAVVPVQISDYVKMHYPDALIVEYEVGKRTYEVKLSNRLELKFNRYFNLVEVDD